MLEFDAAWVKGPHQDLVPPCSFVAPEHSLTVIHFPDEATRTALSLLASGRMRPHRGAVALNGDDQVRTLRRASALVDSPGISAPEHHMKVQHVVAETLALQPRRPDPETLSPGAAERALPRRAAPWLQTTGYRDVAGDHIDTLDPLTRCHLLLTLAFSDPLVHLAVLDSPTRHGADPEALIDLLHAFASVEADTTVLAVMAGPPQTHTRTEGDP